MFNCDKCWITQFPKTKPTMVPAETRKVSYSNQVLNEDLEHEVKITNGVESVRELRLCPKCAGLKVPSDVQVDLSIQVGLGLTMQAHARTCKKLLAECKVCTRNLRLYAELPPQVTARLTSEPLAMGAKFSFATIALDSMFARTTHKKSKRSSMDFLAAYPILKSYETRGGSL